jgi:hypothetical protein
MNQLYAALDKAMAQLYVRKNSEPADAQVSAGFSLRVFRGLGG